MKNYTLEKDLFTVDGVLMNKARFATFVKNQSKVLSGWNAALLFALSEVADQKHNSQPINQLLRLETTRYKNDNLRPFGLQVKQYIEQAVKGICTFDSEAKQFRIKKDREHLSLDTMLQSGLFSDYTEAQADEKAKAAKALQLKKMEENKASKQAREEYNLADAEAKKAEKAAAKAEEKAKAAKALPAIEAAKAKAEAEAAKAEAEEKAAKAEAAKAEAIKRAETTEKERAQAMPRVTAEVLQKQLQHVIWRGLDCSPEDLQHTMDLLEQVRMMVAPAAAEAIKPDDIDLTAFDMVSSVPPSSKAKAAGKVAH